MDKERRNLAMGVYVHVHSVTSLVSCDVVGLAGTELGHQLMSLHSAGCERGG